MILNEGVNEMARIDFQSFLLALFVELVHDANYQNGFKFDHQLFHEFFYKLKLYPRNDSFVEELMFDTNGTYPTSAQIDVILRQFHLSGILIWRS